MQIHIDALRFHTIIGLLDFERTTPQEVIVTCKINYRFENGVFIDYVQVIEAIKQTLIEGAFELLETALHAVATLLHQNFPAIASLSIQIAKPHIIPDAVVSLSETFHF